MGTAVEDNMDRVEDAVITSKRLGTAQMIGITYFAVSGGPFGFEEAVGSAGGTLTYIALLVVPIVWSVPIALMTAELATLIQETGGHVKWVERGLGSTAGFANSMLCIVTSLTDNALYPVMFLDYLTAMVGGLHWAAGLAIKVFLMLVCAAMNIRGVDIVGDTTISFGILVMSPFVVLAIMGAFKAPTGPVDTPSTINWGSFLMVMMWNTSGFDSAGTCAAEVKDGAKTYPRAVSVSLILVILTYVLPMSAALKVTPRAEDWEDGSWVTSADLIAGGHWLGMWMGIAALMSSFGILSTLLCTTSRLFYGVATNGYLPKFFTLVHPTYETPYVVIITNAAISLVFTTMKFTGLAEVTTVFYSTSTILRFLALWRLRVTEPDAERPFAIPGGHFGMAATCVPPIALSIFAISQCRGQPLLTAMLCMALICAATAFFRWRGGAAAAYVPLDDHTALINGSAPRSAMLSYCEIAAWDPDSPRKGARSPSASSLTPRRTSPRRATADLPDGHSTASEADETPDRLAGSQLAPSLQATSASRKSISAANSPTAPLSPAASKTAASGANSPTTFLQSAAGPVDDLIDVNLSEDIS